MNKHSTMELGNKELMKQIWAYLKVYKRPLITSISLLVLSVPLMNFHPMIWGIVADGLMNETLSLETLFYWLGIMVVTYFSGLLLNSLHNYLLEKAGQAFIRDIRSAIFQKFEAQSLHYHKENSTGELVAKITSDVDAMEQSVLQGLTTLLEEIVTFIVVASMVLWISPLVGSLSIIPLAFAFLFIRFYNKKVKLVYEAVRSQLGNIGSFVQDRLAGIPVTQIFTQEKQEQKSFDQKANAFYQSSIQASKFRNTYIPLIASFGFINNLIMLGVGGWLILKGDGGFTIGALIAYRGFWWRLQSPIRTIAQTSDILQKARAAAKRAMGILNEPVEVLSPSETETIRNSPSIHFENVSFHYTKNEEILKDVSFTINPGEFITIAGSSGSGKSTLLHLLCRFYDTTKGKILFNDVELPNINLQELRSHIGLVGQDNYLFDGTIEENIRYGFSSATQDQVVSAAKASNANKFIQSLPNKYETHVGQNGLKLSGGQRQRVSLARTFITNPEILLLDEPTASVEPESESVIYDYILQRKKIENKITILVTHRIDLLKQANRILFFDKGTLSGDGTHKNLISMNTAYRMAYDKWQSEKG